MNTLKFSTLAAALFLSLPLPAQVQNAGRDPATTYFMFDAGRMYEVRNQERNEMHERLTLADGTVIHPDGSFLDRDQKRLRLKDGECLDMYGIRFKTQLELQDRMRHRMQAMQQDHFLFSDGRLYRVRDRMREQVHDPVSLQDGSTVQPDGHLQMKNGRMIRLKNGECLDLAGNRYDSQERFMDRMEHRSMDRDRMEKMDHERHEPMRREDRRMNR